MPSTLAGRKRLEARTADEIWRRLAFAAPLWIGVRRLDVNPTVVTRLTTARQ